MKVQVVDWVKIRVKNIAAIKTLINKLGASNVHLYKKGLVEVLRPVKNKKTISKAIAAFASADKAPKTSKEGE